jgi:phenylpyruvate tautomerase PptA (4-oxalocrotonate tautomerase family)
VQEGLTMPMIDVERVLPDGVPAASPGLAQALADEAGDALGSARGHTWVRVRALPASAYAESGMPPLADDALPVFVTVLQAHPLQGEPLADQVRTLTAALARVLRRDPSRVHVQIAPAAAGRQAFGGRLVT